MAEYIEREALLAEYDRVHVGEPGGARKLMEDAPAADAVEVKHGRWETEIDHDEFWGELDYYKCSLCGNRELRDKQTPYCPNCGARMDGDTDG